MLYHPVPIFFLNSLIIGAQRMSNRIVEAETKALHLIGECCNIPDTVKVVKDCAYERVFVVGNIDYSCPPQK